MELKHLSGALVVAVVLLNIFGWFWCSAFVLGMLSMLVGMLMILYLQHDVADSILHPRRDNAHNNPLMMAEPRHTLGLDFDIAAAKPLLLIPNIFEQTERRRRSGGGGHTGCMAENDGSASKRRKSHAADTTRKRSQIDSGIDLLFHQQCQQHTISSPTKVVPDTAAAGDRHHHQPHRSTKGSSQEDRNKWRPFDSIKVYTERRKSHDWAATSGGELRGPATAPTTVSDNRKSDISIGEECLLYTTMPFQMKTISPPGHHQQHHNHPTSNPNETAADKQPAAESTRESSASPKSTPRPARTMFTGHKGIDLILHTIIDYVLRDYIDSWYSIVSDNSEFSEVRTRGSIEQSVHGACARIKNTQWIPLITTKLADDVATHTRIYRLATQAVAETGSGGNQQQQATSSADATSAYRRHSPQKRMPTATAGAGRKADTLEPPSSSNGASSSMRHRRNKSDTDLSWHLGGSGGTGSGVSAVANSKFYTDPVDEHKLLGDADSRLAAAFFDISDTWRDECMDDRKLDEFLMHASETILYFSIPEEDFACLPLRHFLRALLANVVCRPLLDLLSDPDFINLQLARLVPRETINSEYFIKLTRQCTDLSELRACRQFVVREMDAKYKEFGQSSAELNSLKYTQKLIDLRLSYLQSSKAAAASGAERAGSSSGNSGGGGDSRTSGVDVPILPLEELLTKELALSYYLDYLSILNLQKYVIFYLTALEWKTTATRCIRNSQQPDNAAQRDALLAELRDKAAALHREYLTSGSANYLQIDRGLIEALQIKCTNTNIVPECTWFDSICKFVYEKLKNEDVFLAQFYQSAAYKKLLLELEFCGSGHGGVESLDFESSLGGLNFETSSGDSNSADLAFEEGDEDDELAALSAAAGSNSDDESVASGRQMHSLDVGPTLFRHSRSHSDCTGIFSDPLRSTAASSTRSEHPPRAHSPLPFHGSARGVTTAAAHQPQRVQARIINTAILCDGQYAVYAIEVSVLLDEAAVDGEAGRVKSWHVYRRYSKFLELKKLLVKRSVAIARIPFPAKKTFQNTDRAVLEHRMVVLNEFLRLICQRAEDNPDIHAVVREFMEPDTNDRKMHGGAVIKTIETIVNPIKSGMRTIKNMPDTLVGGIAKILLGRGPMKQSSFLDVMPAIEHTWNYPALTSALNLLDEVFDLQARSQWLRRGIINRLLGAPWVSHATNKKIIHATKAAIAPERIEAVMSAILNNIWPNGGRHRKAAGREDNTKLRTRMAAKIALLSLLADDLKHVVGSETTRSGLLSLLGMLQNRRLNRRLALVIFNQVLTTVLQVDSLTKHVR